MRAFLPRSRVWIELISRVKPIRPKKMVRTIEKADALAAMNMGDVCDICAAMEKKKAFAVYFSPFGRGGRWEHTS